MTKLQQAEAFSSIPSENTDRFKQLLSQSSDVKNRSFTFGNVSSVLIFIDTLIDPNRIEEHILRPLADNQLKEPSKALTILEYVEAFDGEEAVQAIVQGKVLLFMEGDKQCRICGAGKMAPRYNLPYPGNFNEMSKKAEEEIENLLVQTLHKIQAAKCDALGIGRKIIAQSPQEFEQLDWDEAYPGAEMNVKVEVELTENGVIL